MLFPALLGCSLLALGLGAGGQVQAQPAGRIAPTTIADEGWQWRRCTVRTPEGPQDTTRRYPAQVPGTIYQDLMAQGLLADPFWRDNEIRSQWVESEDFEYTRTITLPAGRPHPSPMRLVFDGVDTYARIYWDDVLILATDNMHHPWAVTLPAGRVVPGRAHRLRIRFTSNYRAGLPLWAAEAYKLPAINDKRWRPYTQQEDSSVVRVSPYIRKAPYHFAWDWGPRLVGCGLWQGAHLEATDWGLALDLSTGGAWRPMTAKDTLTRPPRAKLLIMPRHGPDAAGYAFGFTDDKGRPVFIRGANMIPGDMLLPRVNRGQIRRLLTDAARAHMNMVRIWGGGVYASDDLLQIADSMGLYVWHDLMFACSAYPGTEAFFASVKRELAWQIPRLASHRSVVLICGGNEQFQGWQDGWIKEWRNDSMAPARRRADSLRVDRDMKRLFLDSIPTWIARYDWCDPALYWPSSPWPGPLNRLTAPAAAATSTDKRPPAVNDPAFGDRHDWRVWFARVPFEAYRQGPPGRFVSEYGFQALPEWRTVKQYTVPADWGVSRPIMQVHQKHWGGNEKIIRYLRYYYDVPDTSGADFDRYLYMAQLGQARALGTAVSAHRGAAPLCQGTLYWQLNDVWPGASWSTIDYYGRWKGGHYELARRMDPFALHLMARPDALALSALPGGKGTTGPIVEVHWDRPARDRAQIRLELRRLDGRLVARQSARVRLRPGEVGRVQMRPFDLARLGVDSSEVYLSAGALLSCGCEERTALDSYLPPKRLALTEAPLEGRFIPGRAAGPPQLHLRNPGGLALGVYLLPLEAPGVHVGDNFFDMLPGEERFIPLEGEGAASLRPGDFSVYQVAAPQAKPLRARP